MGLGVSWLRGYYLTNAPNQAAMPIASMMQQLLYSNLDASGGFFQVGF
jgi:hypothetical protein